MNKITVKVFDSLGCTVLSSCVFQSLKEKFPDSKIIAYSKFPSLLLGLEEIDDLINSNHNQLKKYDINLEHYLSEKPHNSKPFQHLSWHMIKSAENQISEILNTGFQPKINLNNTETEDAKKIIKSISSKKPVIWLQTETNSKNKNWPQQYWDKIFSEKSKQYTFIDLFAQKYEPRISVAITKFCNAGITLDSFLLHSSYAVNAKNVIAILGSSRPESVMHPNQTPIFESGNCPIQPCGMHGYSSGCMPKDESLFINHEKTNCITDDYRCLTSITPDIVINKLDELIK